MIGAKVITQLRTMPNEKYSFTTCDFVTAYVTFITNNSISAHLIEKTKPLN